MIEIQFSEVPVDLRTSDDFFESREKQWPRTKQIRLPVGLMPMLKVGDIWQDGAVVDSPAYTVENFSDVLINGITSRLIKAGLPDEETELHYLPLDVHPYHVHFTQSFCVCVDYRDSHIVIPCTELLRFYFGSSSTLVSRLFDAPFDARNLWKDSYTQDTDRVAKIHLAPGISGRSASDIGRIAFSKTAKQAAEMIGASCIAASAKGQPAYIKTKFPFEGESCISASGKWLPLGQGSKKVFLVFKLLSCSHPFPFAKLQYTSEQRDRSEGSASTLPSPTNKTDKKILKLPKKLDAKVISAEEPFRATAKRGLGMLFGPMQFPDLARKPVARVDDDQPVSVQVIPEGITNVQSHSVGEGGRSRDVLALDLQSPTQSGVGAQSPESTTTMTALLTQVLEALAATGLFSTCRFIPLNQRQKNICLSIMPQISDEHGEIYPESLYVEPSTSGASSTRNRLVSVAMAESLYFNLILMIPEPRADSAELHVMRDLTRINRDGSQLLASIANHFASRKYADRWTEIREGLYSKCFGIQSGQMFDIDRIIGGLVDHGRDTSNTAAERLQSKTPYVASDDPLAYLK